MISHDATGSELMASLLSGCLPVLAAASVTLVALWKLFTINASQHHRRDACIVGDLDCYHPASGPAFASAAPLNAGHGYASFGYGYRSEDAVLRNKFVAPAPVAHRTAHLHNSRQQRHFSHHRTATVAPGSRHLRRAAALAAAASTVPDVEKLPNSQVSIKVKLSGEDTQDSFDAAANMLSEKDKQGIPGFRRGQKVPMQIIVQHFGLRKVKSYALVDLTDKALARARAAHGLQLIGQPDYDGGEEALLEAFVPGQTLEYDLTCDVWPELKWAKEFGDVDVEYEAEAPDESRVSQALESIRERYVTLEDLPSDHAAAPSEVVVGDMSGFIADDDGARGQPLPDVASGDGVEILLEEGRFMPGMVEGLIGVKAGEVREVRCQFPSQATRTLPAELAGKTAIFDVSVKAVKKRVLPPLDDTLAESLRPGLKFIDLEAEVRDAVGKEQNASLEENRNKALEEAIVEMVECEVPDSMVTEQCKEKFAVMMAEQRAAGLPDEEIKKMITVEGFEKYKKIARPQVEKTIKATIAIEELAATNGISVDEVDIEQQVSLIKAQAQQQGEQIIGDDELKQNIAARLKRDAVLDWVAAQVNVKTVPPKKEKVEA